MTEDIRDKTRAVFLAAIMVLSMVAMAATFAGAAAAINDDVGDIDLTDVNVDPGIAETDNQFTYITDAEGEDDDTEVQYIVVGFDEGEDGDIDLSGVTADDVSVEGDDSGNPGVDSVSVEENSRLNITMADTFDLGNEDGDVNVDVEGVFVGEDGDYDAGIEYVDDNGDAIAGATLAEPYNIGTATAVDFSVDEDLFTDEVNNALAVDSDEDPIIRAGDDFTNDPNVATEFGVLGVPFGLGDFPADPDLNTADQQHTATVSLAAGEEVTVTVDVSETTAKGVDLVGASPVSGDGNFESVDISTDEDDSTITVEIENDDTQEDETDLSLNAEFEVADAAAGVDIDGTSDSVTHTATVGDDEVDDAYRFVDTGIIGISQDANLASTDGERFNLADGAAFSGNEEINGEVPDVDANVGFEAWAGSVISFSDTDSVEFYEVEEVDGEDHLEVGDRVDQIGTSPGEATSYDTSNLDENGEYFIGFEENDDEVAYIDLRPLDLDANLENENVTAGNDVVVDAESEDIGLTDFDGAVQAWLVPAGADLTDANNVAAVDTDNFDGDGEADFSFATTEDEVGEWNVIVAHDESQNFVVTDTVNVTEEPDVDEDVNIISPRSADPRTPQGDFFTVEAELEGVNTATLTIGDRDEQGIEFNVTAQDTSGDGTVEFLVNTWQIGDGPVNSDAEDGDNAHGVTALEGTEIVGEVDAHSSLAIAGGSGDLGEDERPSVVIAGGNYDIVASVGEEAHTEPESFRSDRSVVRLGPRDTGEIATWNTPRAVEDNSAADSETVSEILDAVEDEYVTPQDNVTADDDYLIVQVQETTGLTGLLADESEDSAADFLDRDNDVVTAEWTDTDLLETTFELESDIEQEIARNQPTDDIGNVTLELVEEEVLATSGEDGNLNGFFLLYEVDSEELTTDSEDFDDAGIQDEVYGEVDRPLFNSSFALAPEGTDDPAFELNEFFATEDPESQQFFEWELVDRDLTLEDDEDGTLVVPPRDGYNVTGTTEVASGTEYTTELDTVSGEDPPFFYPNEFTVQYAENAENTFSFTEDFGEFAGAEFAGTIRESDQQQVVAEFGGLVSEVPTVSQHEFVDQDAPGGQVVTVDVVEVSQDATIQIENADGDVIGSTGVDEGETEDISILIDEIEETQELDSVIVDDDGEEFDEEESDAPVRVTATVSVGDEAFFSVDNLDPETATAEPGQELTVTADVTNQGDNAGTQDVSFTLDGEALATEEVELEGGETETVSFTVNAPEEAGDYEHGIASEDDEETGTLTVEEPGEADFQLTLDDGPTEVEPGEAISVTVTVENVGDAEGTQDITFTFDGQEIGSEEVTLGAGDSASQTFDANAPDEEGDYDWEVASDDDSVTGTLTVAADDEPGDDDGDDEPPADDDDDDDADDDGAGFGIAAALIALLGAALLAYRRQLN